MCERAAAEKCEGWNGVSFHPEMEKNMRRFSKMKQGRVLCAVMTAALLMGSLSACSSEETIDLASESTVETSVSSMESGTASVAGAAVSVLTVEELFSDRDLSGEYDEDECVKITLTGESATCEGDGVTVDGGNITITSEGTYLITGELTDGMITVDVNNSEKVQLVLAGCTISNSENACIYVKQADKVFLTLASGTENSLTSSAYEELDGNHIDACIFSKEDLTINGSGALTVEAGEGHAIVSKDDLKVTGGTIVIAAEGQGLSGKDSVCIADGEITITSGKDGIHAENEDDTDEGYVYIADGTITITSDGDGISASAVLQIDGGTFTITSGGGNENAQTSLDENGETISTKGIKAAGDLVINGGSFTVDAQDDAIHTNADLTVTGGRFSLESGDDGMHADENNTVSGGTITIAVCYEGIEGSNIEITGGVIDIDASDDGINAAGGNDESGMGGMFGADSFSSSGDYEIVISGGEITIDADGDGIDSNGDLTVSGGTIIVQGPTSAGDGALDYDGNATITGGTFVAIGSSGMAMNFGESSTQGSILLDGLSGQTGDAIILLDANGNELLTVTATKSFASIVLSCASLTVGETYTISVAGDETQVTLDSTIYGSGGMGGMDGMAPGGDGMPEGEMPSGEAPDGEAPAMPNGEAPNGEVPQMPNGEAPNGNGGPNGGGGNGGPGGSLPN